MQTSSIYIKCPGCAATTLIERRGARCMRAASGFDYNPFRNVKAAFEQYLVERMHEGTMGILGVSALNQFTSTDGAAASAASQRALASLHGIPLPNESKHDPILRAALAIVVLIALAVVAFVGYFIILGAQQGNRLGDLEHG